MDEQETGRIIYEVTRLLLPRMHEAQSLAVGVVSGATLSSVGTLNAVAVALEQAGATREVIYAEIPQAEPEKHPDENVS